MWMVLWHCIGQQMAGKPVLNRYPPALYWSRTGLLTRQTDTCIIFTLMHKPMRAMHISHPITCKALVRERGILLAKQLHVVEVGVGGGSHITAPLERQFTIKSAGQQKFYWFKTWIIHYTKKLSYISRGMVNQLIRKKRQRKKNLCDCPLRQHLMLLLFVAAKENTPSYKKWWPRRKLVPYYHYMDLCVHQPMETGWGGMPWRDQRLFKLIQPFNTDVVIP